MGDSCLEECQALYVGLEVAVGSTRGPRTDPYRYSITMHSACGYSVVRVRRRRDVAPGTGIRKWV